MSLDDLMTEEQMTVHVRGLVASAPSLFKTAAKTAAGRRMLRDHRRIAKQRLESATEWEERAYAALVLRLIDAALPKPKRKPQAATSKDEGLPYRTAVLADRIQILLADHAASESPRVPYCVREDIREAWCLARKIERLHGGLPREWPL